MAIDSSTREPVRALSALFVVSAVFLTQGCASIFSPPSVRIVGVELVAVGLTEGLAEVTLEVANEGIGDLNINGILYDLEVNTSTERQEWITLSNGFFDGAVSIPRGRTERVKVPVPFEYQAVGEAVRTFLRRGEVPYRLSGEVWVGGSGVGLQIPFRTQGILEP
jgi:LEA14-like dessication related protein